jgi:hypothetical protein
MIVLFYMKILEKIKAVELRKQGKSYSHILKFLKVSKSTLSSWLRDIELTKIQQQKLLKIQDKSRSITSLNRINARVIRTHKITEDAKKEFMHMAKNPIFLPGLALYWAEGDKHAAERVKFTNSDANMIKFMMRWFREICNVPQYKFRIAIHAHSLHTIPFIEDFWSNTTGINKNQFQKIFIKPTSLGQRRNVLYQGTCGIVVCNKDLFRKIMGWKEALIDSVNNKMAP